MRYIKLQMTKRSGEMMAVSTIIATFYIEHLSVFLILIVIYKSNDKIWNECTMKVSSSLHIYMYECMYIHTHTEHTIFMHSFHVLSINMYIYIKNIIKRLHKLQWL